ncbi:MAG TPA: hypothetical protein VHR45_08330 [Thermoanaerobaculia bacterium]|nr:hypothetical protein [Thermoanaerobaculia bacterium]
MDEAKRKEFQSLLGTIESHKELEQIGERQRLIERNRHIYRFEELVKTVVVPTLRLCMLHLDQKGHFSRLREISPRRVRLDVHIQAGVMKRGTIELALIDSEPEKLRVDYSWGWRKEQEVHRVDELRDEFVADRVLHLLKGVL